MKKAIKLIFFNLIIIFFIFAVIEIFLIFYDKNHLRYDHLLGWTLKENLKIKKTDKDLYGNKYKIEFKTNEYGIIQYGNSEDNEILVIGDSFSSDPYVSTDKMWYSILAKKLKSEDNLSLKVKAIGAGGYGTFQQYLLLKRIKEKVNPKLIILQFCTNDLENNYYEFESKVGSLSQFSRRPYYKNEEIFYSDLTISKLLRIKYIGQSRIINKIIFLTSKNLRKKIISEEVKRESEYLTIFLLEKIRNVFPNKDFYIFNCNLDNIKLNEFSKKADFNVLYTVKQHLDYAKSKSLEIYYKDGGHYNELGNKIIGEAIYDYFYYNSISNYFQ